MITLERESIFDNEEREKINEKEIIELAKEGDEGAWKDLINKYKNLFFKLANKYKIYEFDKEDIIQEGLIGLFKAIRDYNPDKNYNFKSFLYYVTKKRIFSLIRNSKRQKRKVEYVELKENNNLIEDKKVEKIEIKEIINKVKNNLSILEEKVLESYLENLSYNEIAKELGINKKQIDNTLKRIKNKIKEVVLC